MDDIWSHYDVDVYNRLSNTIVLISVLDNKIKTFNDDLPTVDECCDNTCCNSDMSELVNSTSVDNDVINDLCLLRACACINKVSLTSYRMCDGMVLWRVLHTPLHGHCTLSKVVLKYYYKLMNGVGDLCCQFDYAICG